jgi:hypothetical protein
MQNPLLDVTLALGRDADLQQSSPLFCYTVSGYALSQETSRLILVLLCGANPSSTRRDLNEKQVQQRNQPDLTGLRNPMR